MPEREWVNSDDAPAAARGAPDMQCSPEVGLQRTEDAIIHPGKVTIVCISYIVTCACSINSVF